MNTNSYCVIMIQSLNQESADFLHKGGNMLLKLCVLMVVMLLIGSCVNTPQKPLKTGLTLMRPGGTGEIFGSTMPAGTPEAAEIVALGYVEEEYFLSGSANVYRYGEEGQIEVAKADVPYTTRLLIVRPSDTAKFNGCVLFEPFHPGGGNSWASTREHILREGVIFVGVFVGPSKRSFPQDPRPEIARRGIMADPLGSLIASSPERYAPMNNWPRDDGIKWDVFGQTACLLRSDSADNPLRDVDISGIYAMGWSATGSFLRTFTNEGFHERHRLPDGSPAINGYLIGISQGGSCSFPLT